MFKKTTFLPALVISLIAIFLIPIILDWVIIGNNVPSNISNPDWVNFLGGYIGAIIGAIVSLVGITITIRYNSKQNRSAQELQIGPYCIVRYIPDSKVVVGVKQLGHIAFSCETQAHNGPSYNSVVYIKNIGLGPAIEFRIEANAPDDGREHYSVIFESTPELRNLNINHLQTGEEASIPIIIYFNFDPITEDDFISCDNNGITEKMVSPKVFKKYKSFDLTIKIFYFDMFRNEYTQQIKLGFGSHIRTIGQKTGEHIPGSHLKEYTTPKRV